MGIIRASAQDLAVTSELPHSGRTFLAVFAQLSPVRPLHLSSLNHPRPFRHLPSPFHARGLAQGPLTAGLRRTHSFKNFGVYWATSGASSVRPGRWGLRNTGPLGVSLHAAWEGPTVQTQPESKGLPPACRNSFRNKTRGPRQGMPHSGQLRLTQARDPAGTQLSG